MIIIEEYNHDIVYVYYDYCYTIVGVFLINVVVSSSKYI